MAMAGMEGVRSAPGKKRPGWPSPKPVLMSKNRRKIFSAAKNELMAYSPKFIKDSKFLRSGFPSSIIYNSDIEVYYEMHAALLIALGLKRLKKMRILEIGPNFGPYMHYLQHVHGSHITGIEIREGCVKNAVSGGLDMIHGDARKMPFEDGSFDLVIARGLRNPFEKMPPALMRLLAPDPNKYPPSTDTEFEDAISKEVHRVMKKGGYFFSQSDSFDPTSSPELFSSASQIVPPEDSRTIYPIYIAQK